MTLPSRWLVLQKIVRTAVVLRVSPVLHAAWYGRLTVDDRLGTRGDLFEGTMDDLSPVVVHGEFSAK